MNIASKSFLAVKEIWEKKTVAWYILQEYIEYSGIGKLKRAKLSSKIARPPTKKVQWVRRAKRGEKVTVFQQKFTIFQQEFSPNCIYTC